MYIITQLEKFAGAYGARFIIAVVIFIVGIFIVKILKKIKKTILSKLSLDETLKSFLNSTLNSLLYFILGIIVLTVAGVPSSYFAGLIIGLGTALGFALRDEFKTISNGIIILLTKPFRVGDAICVNNIYGTVRDIKLFQTTLRTFDNLEIHLSNGSMLSNGITILNSEEPRRQDITIGVSYDDDVTKVKKLLDKIIEDNEFVLKDPAPMIALNELADSSVNFLIRIWTERPNFLAAKFKILEDVKITLDKEGITIPYPQRDVHVYGDKIKS
jgi:small conductance mechanosensitive channel